MAIGFDCGTFNLVCAQRDEKGNIVHKREINAFLEMPIENRFVFNMMRNAGVPLIERPEAGIAYALGEAAVNMAYTMPQIELKRPMKDGCLNPKEKHAQQIMTIMIHSLLDEIKQDKEVLYYSVPADAVNQETDSEYHSKVLDLVFKSYTSDSGKKVEARPINEGLALVYAELAKEAYSGIGVSFGAGMVNLCFAIFGAPVFQFSIVNSGDWIDKQTAKVTGETPTYINKEKMKLDFNKPTDSLLQQAIRTQYEIMIQKTVAGIKKGLDEAGNKARMDKPINVVVSGGTASPPGFEKVFEDALRGAKLTVEVGAVMKPADTLYSVARGCLIAAEASN